MLGIYTFDCNDPAFGGGGQPLFSGYINYGTKGKTLAQSPWRRTFTESYGAAQADAMIAATNGQAKIIFFNDPEFVVLHYTGEGFLNEIKNKCPGCSIVDKVDFNGTELGSVLQQKASAALLQHPEANAIKSPYTAASILGISPAVSQSGRAGNMYVMGGEGFQPELDLLRAHQGVNAVMIAPSDWTGWAAVDTMNSLFLHKPPAFSGLGWELVDADPQPAGERAVPGLDRLTRRSTRRPGASGRDSCDRGGPGPGSAGPVPHQDLLRRARAGRP